MRKASSLERKETRAPTGAPRREFRSGYERRRARLSEGAGAGFERNGRGREGKRLSARVNPRWQAGKRRQNERVGDGVELAERTGIVAIARLRGCVFAVLGLNAKDRPIAEKGLQICADRDDVRVRRHPVERRRQHLGDEREDRQASRERRAKSRQGADRALSSLSLPPALPAQPKSPRPIILQMQWT